MSPTSAMNDCYGHRAEGTGILPPAPKHIFHLAEQNQPLGPQVNRRNVFLQELLYGNFPCAAEEPDTPRSKKRRQNTIPVGLMFPDPSRALLKPVRGAPSTDLRNWMYPPLYLMWQQKGSTVPLGFASSPRRTSAQVPVLPKFPANSISVGVVDQSSLNFASSSMQEVEEECCTDAGGNRLKTQHQHGAQAILKSISVHVHVCADVGLQLVPESNSEARPCLG